MEWGLDGGAVMVGKRKDVGVDFCLYKVDG